MSWPQGGASPTPEQNRLVSREKADHMGQMRAGVERFHEERMGASLFSELFFFFFSVKEAARSLTAREMLLEEKRRGTRELP